MQDKEYLKFLKKRPAPRFPIGEKMKDQFIIDRNGTKINLTYGSTGTVIFFMSNTCEKCDFSLINQYAESYYFKTYIFVDAGEEFVSEVKLRFQSFEINRSDLTVLFKEINLVGVPVVYSLNKVGQIVGAGIFNSFESLNRKISPLIDVFGTGKIAR